jgi:hypothetical protein
MKTKTETKTLKAMMQTPIGGATETKPTAKAKPEAKAKTRKAKGAGLYYFGMTPAGRMLRAYFVAFITAQVGGLNVGKVFRLWPNANVRGHLATGKVARKENGYALSQSGRTYFLLDEQVADKEMTAKFLKAIKTGNKPDIYKHEMIELAAK